MRHRHGRTGRGCAHGANQGKDVQLFNELDGIDDRLVRGVHVIKGVEAQEPAVDAALLIDFMEGGLYAKPHVVAQRRGGAAERGALPKEDLPV